MRHTSQCHGSIPQPARAFKRQRKTASCMISDMASTTGSVVGPTRNRDRNLDRYRSSSARTSPQSANKRAVAIAIAITRRERHDSTARIPRGMMTATGRMP